MKIKELADAIEREHDAAWLALAQRDTAGHFKHAREYHRLASEHDALTGGNIRQRYSR